jgi:hypothetical protein
MGAIIENLCVAVYIESDEPKIYLGIPGGVSIPGWA